MKKQIIIGALLLAALSASAQSDNFKLARWNELNCSVIKELNRSYVDALPIEEMQKAGIDAMLEKLDPYTIFIPESDNEDFELMISRTYGGIGAIIYKPDLQGNVVINEPYADSPAVRFGLQCGDEILKIDGKDVHGLTTKECSERMKGKPDTQVTLTVKKVRSGEVKDIKVRRERIRIPDVEYYAMLNDTTGYVLLNGFTEGVASEIRGILEGMKRDTGIKQFVLDLRGNGGGLLGEAVELVSLFVPKGSLVVTSKGKNEKVREYRTSKDPVDVNLPLIVMVNSGSASASEIVSGALQDLDRATIMGERTFGKGLVQDVKSLPYGNQMKVTVAKYYTPSGRCVQAIDYSNRNEDGSVGAIPDSLTHEFKTASGRIVKDGGGIDPDVKIKGKELSGFAAAMYMNGTIERYVLHYVRSHDSIPEVKDWHFEDYDDFVAFEKKDTAEFRTPAMESLRKMKEEFTKSNVSKELMESLENLEECLSREKEIFFVKDKDVISHMIEKEIAVRYYYQKAGIEVDLRYDTALKEALKSPKITVKK